MGEKRMTEDILRRRLDHIEPVHIRVIDFEQGCVAIYKVLKEKYQRKIDAAFNSVSKQIGFVVTSTLPCKLVVDGGMIKSVSIGAENFKGTLFEREFMPALKGLTEEKLPMVAAGTYNIYLLWPSAIKIKFLRDHVEPVHRIMEQVEVKPPVEISIVTIWEAMEPAQFLIELERELPSQQLALLSAINEVYSELNLMKGLQQIQASMQARQ